MNTGLLQILKNKIIAIIRGANPDEVSKIAIALQQGGVTILEVTLNSQSAFAVIKELSNKLSNGMLIGAGTVLDAKDAKAAIEAGARFIVSPNMHYSFRNESMNETQRNDLCSWLSTECRYPCCPQNSSKQALVFYCGCARVAQ